ncbi:MAG: serine/threonine-protein kinase [Myxococcaceae bacterium]
MSGYVAFRRLAGGPATEVWLAQLAGESAPAAVELLRPELLDQPEIVGRFLGEAERRQRLSHRHLVTRPTLGRTDDGRPFLATEPLPRENLRALLRTKGPMSFQAGLNLVAQVCDALTYLHGQGFVHGKLSPAMVYVRDQGARLMDYGLGLAPRSAVSRAPSWSEALYRCPELWQGKRLDARSDVYGLGLLLYETLVGMPVFPGVTADEMGRRHLGMARPPVPEAFARLQPLLSRCWAPRSEDRLESPALVAEEVRRLSQRRSLRAALSDDWPTQEWVMPQELAPPEPVPASGVPKSSGQKRWMPLALAAALATVTVTEPRSLSPVDVLPATTPRAALYTEAEDSALCSTHPPKVDAFDALSLRCVEPTPRGATRLGRDSPPRARIVDR